MAKSKNEQAQATDQAMSIGKAAEYLGVSEARVRTLLREQKLHTVERDVEGVAGATIKVLLQSELAAYKAVSSERKRGSKGGKTAFVIRLDDEQRAQLQAMGFELTRRFTYKAKADDGDDAEQETASNDDVVHGDADASEEV